jgi:serine/threonine protein kinase
MSARPRSAGPDGLYAGPPDDPDRYRVGDAVGVGGEGAVHRAQVLSEGEFIEVAIKVWNRNDDDPGFDRRVRLWQDQRILLQSVTHPNIVRVHDVFVGAPPHRRGHGGDARRSLYLVMDWLPGSALSVWRVGRRDLTYAQVCKILVPIAEALGSLHGGREPNRQPILHRDLKPANVMIGEDGTAIKIVDFGLARGAHRAPAAGGTPGYTAPEVVERGAFSDRSDVFSLGALAYWLITGASPPDRPADHLDDIRSRLAGTDMLADAPEIVDHICWALAPRAEDRPDVKTWAAGLRDTNSTGMGSAIPPPAPPGRRPRPPRANSQRARLLAAVGVVAALVAGLLYFRERLEESGMAENPSTTIVAADSTNTTAPALVDPGTTSTTVSVPDSGGPASTTTAPRQGQGQTTVITPSPITVAPPTRPGELDNFSTGDYHGTTTSTDWTPSETQSGQMIGGQRCTSLVSQSAGRPATLDIGSGAYTITGVNAQAEVRWSCKTDAVAPKLRAGAVLRVRTAGPGNLTDIMLVTNSAGSQTSTAWAMPGDYAADTVVDIPLTALNPVADPSTIESVLIKFHTHRSASITSIALV